jgi:hypothetical protein
MVGRRHRPGQGRVASVAVVFLRTHPRGLTCGHFSRACRRPDLCLRSAGRGRARQSLSLVRALRPRVPPIRGCLPPPAWHSAWRVRSLPRAPRSSWRRGLRPLPWHRACFRRRLTPPPVGHGGRSSVVRSPAIIGPTCSAPSMPARARQANAWGLPLRRPAMPEEDAALEYSASGNGDGRPPQDSPATPGCQVEPGGSTSAGCRRESCRSCRDRRRKPAGARVSVTPLAAI